MLNLTALWRRLVVLLVLLIAVLQVIHLALLSRLEARKGGGHQRHQAEDEEVALEREMHQMLSRIKASSILDSSGQFRIVASIARPGGDASGKTRQDLSLVTHSTVTGLKHLQEVIERWDGPLSVSVFSVTQDVPLALEAIASVLRCVPPSRRHASFHLVYPLAEPRNLPPTPLQPRPPPACDTYRHRIADMPVTEVTSDGYPANLLRNVGRAHSRSALVLVTEAEMLPSHALRPSFLRFARSQGLFSAQRDDRTAYVVPAFEVKDNADMPKDKTELLQLLEVGDARPRCSEACWRLHKQTDFEAWQREPPSDNTTVLFEVLWRDPWQPFYIARNGPPQYDERFSHASAYDVTSQVCELHVSGYKFSVLSDAFMVRRGFVSSSSPTLHTHAHLDQERDKLLFRHFKAQLKDKYPDSSRKCY